MIDLLKLSNSIKLWAGSAPAHCGVRRPAIKALVLASYLIVGQVAQFGTDSPAHPHLVTATSLPRASARSNRNLFTAELGAAPSEAIAISKTQRGARG